MLTLALPDVVSDEPENIQRLRLGMPDHADERMFRARDPRRIAVNEGRGACSPAAAR